MTLLDRVREAYQNALENAPEWLEDASDIEVAADMVAYAEEFEEEEIAAIEKCVAAVRDSLSL